MIFFESTEKEAAGKHLGINGNPNGFSNVPSPFGKALDNGTLFFTAEEYQLIDNEVKKHIAESYGRAAYSIRLRSFASNWDKLSEELENSIATGHLAVSFGIVCHWGRKGENSEEIRLRIKVKSLQYDPFRASLRFKGYGRKASLLARRINLSLRNNSRYRPGFM